MRILGTICARGGSKGIKNKNIRTLYKKPLIAHSIEALKAWGKANRIVCSTDSEQIKKISNEYGAETPFIRPAELATDSASKLSVWQHMVKFCEKEENNKYDFIVDLDPTSPLRLVKDIDNGFEKLKKFDADIIFSVYKADKNPYFNMIELDENNYAHLCKTPKEYVTSRQQSPKVYSLNASIYILKRDFLIQTSNILSGKCIIYEMSDFSIDIDREIDFEFIEFILNKGLFKFDF